VTFEEYLVSKNIDGNAFLKAEPSLYATWKIEFEQMHRNSFTVQKLNLINPLRRKYLLKVEPAKLPPPQETAAIKPAQPTASPTGKPVMQPKPKFK
jgi:hypothetical protein